MSRPDHPRDRATDAPVDPVLVRRAQVARWTLLANRIGWILLAVAVALFVVVFMVGLTPAMITSVTALLIASFVLLAPSIVLGYAVRAADREDRETGIDPDR